MHWSVQKGHILRFYKLTATTGSVGLVKFVKKVDSNKGILQSVLCSFKDLNNIMICFLKNQELIDQIRITVLMNRVVRIYKDICSLWFLIATISSKCASQSEALILIK